MRCLICGKLSLPGAKLCLDCKAARKRAFDATVTQPLLAAAGAARGSSAAPRLLKPSQTVPDAARRAAKMAMTAQAQSKADVDVPPPRASRWPIVVGAVCVLAVGVAFFAHWYGAGKTETFTPVASEPPTAESARVPSLARTAPPTTTPAPAAVPVGIDATTPEPSTVKPEAPKRPSTRARIEKAPPPPPAPEPTPPPPVVVAAPPPAPVVREPPRVDPWQPMNDALSRCPSNDISGRYSCEQRVKARYCEGHWGQVPQCASIPYVDHGQ